MSISELTITDSSKIPEEYFIAMCKDNYDQLHDDVKTGIKNSWIAFHQIVQTYLKQSFSVFYCDQNFMTLIDRIFLREDAVIRVAALPVENDNCKYIDKIEKAGKINDRIKSHFDPKTEMSNVLFFDFKFKKYSEEMIERLDERTIVHLRISALHDTLALQNYERAYLFSRFEAFKKEDADKTVLNAAALLNRIKTLNATRLKFFLTDHKAGNKNIAAILLVSGNIVGVGLKDPQLNQKHAEMILLDKFQNLREKNDAVLISSLQPCRMCFGRISFWSSIKYCYYLQSDPHDILSFDTNFPLRVRGGRLAVDAKTSTQEEELDLTLNFLQFFYLVQKKFYW
jgi:tRNA(Arg) A34 adenosine deaminase TadA